MRPHSATSFHLLSAKNQGFNETFHQQFKRELEPLRSLHCTASVITYLSADERLNFAPIESTQVFVVVDFTGSRIEPFYIYINIYKYIYICAPKKLICEALLAKNYFNIPTKNCDLL